MSCNSQSLPLQNTDRTRDANQALKPFYRIWPPFNLGEGLMAISRMRVEQEVIGRSMRPFEWDVAGRSIFLLLLQVVGFSALTLVLDARWAGRCYDRLRARARKLRGLCCGCVRVATCDRCGDRGSADSAADLASYRDALDLAMARGNHGRSGRPEEIPGLVGLEMEAKDGGGGSSSSSSSQGDSRRGGSILSGDGEEEREDPDVAAERRRVEDTIRGGGGSGGGGNRSGLGDNPVILRNLRKVYAPRGTGGRGARSRLRAAQDEEAAAGGGGGGGRGGGAAAAAGDLAAMQAGASRPKVAVRDLSLQLDPSQCFGFLGVNGAGKTTTMSILTGDAEATAGDAWIRGHSVRSQMRDVRKHIGYCPQFDPLLDLMTARETLAMYARLRGVKHSMVARVVENAVATLGLSRWADRPCGTYSGGNRRKLSLGVAMIGNPSVVFLDEPSTGMDPVARRKMWNIIEEAKRGRSIMLTTHSMEECEALCTRIGILTSGRMRCLGSAQHLKSRFGREVWVDVNIEDDGCGGQVSSGQQDSGKRRVWGALFVAHRTCCRLCC